MVVGHGACCTIKVSIIIYWPADIGRGTNWRLDNSLPTGPDKTYGMTMSSRDGGLRYSSDGSSGDSTLAFAQVLMVAVLTSALDWAR